MVVLVFGWVVQDISILWARPAKRGYILELARPGRPWAEIERELSERHVIYSAASTEYGPDPTRFINLDDVGSYTLDWLEKVGIHDDNRAWVILTFDASNRIKTVRTEYP
jgi:hypothetical protein